MPETPPLTADERWAAIDLQLHCGGSNDAEIHYLRDAADTFFNAIPTEAGKLAALEALEPYDPDYQS